MPIPLAVPLVAAGIQTAIGLFQRNKGVKEAKKADAALKAQQDAYSQTTLPEYRDIEARYKRISESGMEGAEVNEFMRRAQSAQYAQQMAAQTMAGGSLARYTLALNNATMLGQIGTLAAQNFQRKMQGMAGYERQLGMRQQRTDTDTAFKRQMLMQKGQAAAGLAQSGMANITGALSGITSGAMSALAGGGGGGDRTTGGTTGGGMVGGKVASSGGPSLGTGASKPIEYFGDNYDAFPQ